MNVLTQAKIDYQTQKDNIHIIIRDVPAEIVVEDGVEHQLLNMDIALRLEQIVQDVRTHGIQGKEYVVQFS